MNRHRALGCCLRMIFPENRFALFRIMLWSLRVEPAPVKP
ncbi:hypothetical protein GGD63_007852 [Bradyrhizobium sp. cir1]|nr:hypothetical protein [Bradyrhizobium sp. cir1]